ncbi:MAG TPA: hypothetical protein VE645_19185 [Pseudonocardiaceae bacterium]|nr:hypothetical protein [Pseudonocardiaceae bacterium]
MSAGPSLQPVEDPRSQANFDEIKMAWPHPVADSGPGVTAGAGLDLTGDNLSVNVDNSSIEIASDTLRVKALGVTNAHLAGSIDNAKLTTNPLARANHTGTQTAATVADFDTQVRTSRLDQMASATAVLVGVTPTDATHLATKGYVDTAVSGTGPGTMPTSAVTTLPGSPSTGDYIWFRTAAMAALTVPVSWLLMFDGSKWIPFGAMPILIEVAASTSTASTSYTLTSGPDIAVPVAGIYEVAIGARMHNSSVGTQALMSYAIGGTGAVDADNLDSYNGSAHTVSGNLSRSMTKTLTAVTLASRYRAGIGGTAFFEKRWMKLTPLRLG